MHAFICMCVQVCARVLNITRVFAGVCQWKKPGQVSGGENARV